LLTSISQKIIPRYRGSAAKLGLKVLLISGLLLTVNCWAQETDAPAAKSPEGAPATLTLPESLQLALEHNPTLKIAKEQVAQARFAAQGARGGYGPTLGGSVNYDEKSSVSSITLPTLSGYQTIELDLARKTIAQASLTLPLDISRQISTAVQSADLTFLSQECQLATVSQKLSLQVQEAYLAVLRTQDLQQVAEDSLAAGQEHLRIAQSQQLAGVVPKFDVLRAEVEVANYRQSLVSAQNDVALAKAGLNRVMGLTMDNPLQLQEPALSEAPALDLTAGQQEAEQRRPEILRARIQTQAAHKGVKLARAGLEPSLALVGDYNFAYRGTDFDNVAESWEVVASLSLPVFDRGATRAKVNQAKSAVAAADYNEQDISQQIALELRQAYLDLQNAQERRQSTDKDVEQAKEALRLAQVRYQAGVSTAVEVIDAEAAFAQSRSNQVNARFDYQLSQAQLNYALGRPLISETSPQEETH